MKKKCGDNLKEVVVDNQNVQSDTGKGNENEKQVDYKKIYGIAKIQKVFICAMLLYLISLLLLFTFYDYEMAIMVFFIGSNLFVLICGLLIAMRVSGMGLAIIYGLTFFIPFMAILVMLLINERASKKIKEAGFNVGFFGAKLKKINKMSSLTTDSGDLKTPRSLK